MKSFSGNKTLALRDKYLKIIKLLKLRHIVNWNLRLKSRMKILSET